MITALVVMVLGGFGAVARYLVDAGLQARRRTEFPLGTLVVNLGGSFGLGILAGLNASSHVTLLAGTAAIGSYTTFSTWMLESHRPAQDGEPGMARRNLIIALVGGLALVAAGHAIGRLM